jgi:hypothetical protein
MRKPKVSTGTAGMPAVACALTAAQLTAQFARWQQLTARAMTSRAETADGIRLVFRPEPGVGDELRSLVVVEQECCAWAAWSVRESAAQIVVDVSSSGEGIATLHGMFSALQPDLRSGDLR